MFKGQKSSKNGIENFLCPFTDMYISQGSNGAYSHKGILAHDVRGKISGVRYPYFAPCTCKCIRTYPVTGQVMWQSINKVRFANGRIDFATFMTAHDDTMDAKVGMIVPQGNQLGNMGRKGFSNITGIHCHIQISQSKDTTWYKNAYGNYKFNNEYEPEDCYFVDNTNIVYAANITNWKKTDKISVDENPHKEAVDQILHVGSKVKFDGIFKVDIVRTPYSTNLFGNTQLTGVSFNDYQKERAKQFHWIPLNDWTEVDRYGNSKGQDQIVVGGYSYVLNKNTYIVQSIDVRTNSARLCLNGHDIWVFSTYLYEI